MNLAATLRQAARQEAEIGFGHAFDGIEDWKTDRGLVDLWISFTGGCSMAATQEERVFGLLLLAEILESAE